MYNRSEGPINRAIIDHNSEDLMSSSLNEEEEEEEEDLNYYRHMNNDPNMDQLERGLF